MKAATQCVSLSLYVCIISIHAAREGGDCAAVSLTASSGISIHAAREGGDMDVWDECYCAHSISIHAAREGGDYGDEAPGIIIDISIHAAREGGDVGCRETPRHTGDFNPRRP